MSGETPVYVGLDIGGTKLLVAAEDMEGRERHRVRAATPEPLDEGLALLHAMIAEVAGGAPIRGMGAAIGGPLDWEQGIVSPLHQPEWRAVPLRAIMEARWRCRFQVDVDTNIAALGEYHRGGVQSSRLLYMTLSTGVGGGLLVDGKIYRGAAGGHPEVGHQAIPLRVAEPALVACACGATDCLEALISGRAIQRLYGVPAEMLNEREWGEVAYHLGQGLRNLAVVYLPDVIVLGGGVALGGGASLLGQARAVMIQGLRLVPPPKIRLATLGADASLAGALEVARRGLGR